MLYRFKSRATADLIMLQPHARRILQILGKDPDAAHGIVTAEQIPAAIAALRAAVAQEESPDNPATAGAGMDDTPEDALEQAQAGDAIRLRQRAAPFIDMLQRSAAENYEVTW